MSRVPLVVIGASAGGVEALLDVVAGFPADLAAGVLVTVHTGARPETALPRVLDRAGPLGASQAVGGEAIRAGHILVAPPDRHLVATRDGAVALSAGPRVNHYRPAADVMFGSVARTHGTRAVAVVLSGTLDDGAVGAALIARAGGRVLVQDPTEARFDSMPRSAHAAVPDAMVATAKELGPRLAEVVTAMPDEPRPSAADDPSTPPRRSMADSADPSFLNPDESAATRMTCPECSGSLGRIDLPHISYYRCHVGHQYGPRSLEAARREAAEATLWSAVAALEEHAALAHHLAGGDPADTDYTAAADHSAGLAATLRERLTGSTAPVDPERPQWGRARVCPPGGRGSGNMTADNSPDAVATIASLTRGLKIAMLTTVDPEGHLTARPMAQQETEFDGDLWFFVEKDSRTARNLAANPHVGVSLTSNSTWVSLSGTAELVDDAAKVRDLWNAWVEAWMPGGPDDPNLTLIHFHAETGEYWDTPGGLVASVLSFAKSKVTGNRYEGADSDTVNLRR